MVSSVRETLKPITISVVKQSKVGNDIVEVRSFADAIAHEDSSDSLAFSVDSRFLSLMDQPNIGTWWAIELATWRSFEIGPRIASISGVNAVNNNLVWDDAADNFWWIENGILQRRNVAGTIFASSPLPSSVVGPNGNSISPAWALENCAGPESGQLLSLYDNATTIKGWLEVTLNGSTIDFGPAVWASVAYANGRANGSVHDIGPASPGVVGIHNIECAFGGIYGGLTARNGSSPIIIQGSYVWAPLNGSTMVSITPNQVGDPNIFIHPAQDGNLVFFGNNQNGQLEIREVTSPPTTIDFTQSALWTFDKSPLLPDFTTTNPNALQWWHGDARNGHLAMSVLSFDDPEVGIYYADYSGLPSNGPVPVCIDSLIPAEVTGDFLDTSRPAISPDGRIIAWHQSNATGRRCVRYTKVN